MVSKMRWSTVVTIRLASSHLATRAPSGFHAEGPLKNRPTLSIEDIRQIDQGTMRSLGGRYIDGTELHQLLDEDTSGILEDNPIINWTEEDR